MKNSIEGLAAGDLETAFRRCLTEMINRARLRKYAAEGDPGGQGTDEYDANAKNAANRLANLIQLRDKYEVIE